MGRHRSASALLVALATGCQPLPEIDYRTQHIDLAVLSGQPVCAGTLAELDTHVERTAEALGVSPDRYEVYLTDGWPDEWCPPDTGGCYDELRAKIFSSSHSLHHELVHAISTPVGRGLPFFEEGNAYDLQGTPALFGESLPSQNLPNGLDFPTSSHFMRWIRHEYGSVTTRRILGDIDNTSTTAYARRRFGEIMGEPFDAVERRYLAEAPAFYPGQIPHSDPLQLRGPQRIEVEFDCETDPNTFGVDGWVERRIDLEVETAGMWLVHLGETDAAVTVHRRRLQPLEELPTDPAHFHTYDVARQDTGREFLPRFDNQVALEVGPYSLLVRQPASRPDPVSIEMWPPPGSTATP